MHTEHWQQLAAGKCPSDPTVLAEMERLWPYFVWPALLALEQGVADGTTAQRLRSRIALATGDREALERILLPDSDFDNFYPDMQPVQLSTNATIDAFLNRFGSETDKETDMLTRMIFDTGPREGIPQSSRDEDAGTAAHQPDSVDADQDPTASRIDAFLAASRQPARTPEALLGLEQEEDKEDAPTATDTDAGTADSQTQQPSQLSISLAQMMIRNHNYTTALEILNRLNLENPEKSSIFADQIRFLKKLILNQNHRNQ